MTETRYAVPVTRFPPMPIDRTVTLNGVRWQLTPCEHCADGRSRAAKRGCRTCDGKGYVRSKATKL